MHAQHGVRDGGAAVGVGDDLDGGTRRGHAKLRRQCRATPPADHKVGRPDGLDVTAEPCFRAL
eukprot:4927802-Prymnesium_polylepis.1